MDEARTSDDLFLHLTPEKVLEAVERAGLETRPVCYPLNSFENRVYEVELADRTRVVAKFYRPGRWSKGQILEEHAWLAELHFEELPVCEPKHFPDGSTLQEIDGVFYGLWERRGGRAPDEIDDDLAFRLGMFCGRMHGVAARGSFEDRPRLDADRYIRRQLDFLERERMIPRALEARYLRAAEAIADAADRDLAGADLIRVHADLHLGNVLLRDGVLNVLDFDDACMGPAVQDLWLAIPGRDVLARRRQEKVIDGYERFRRFDRGSLEWIETLRGLRLVRYCGWLARRWHDPAFRQGWPQFGGEAYWQHETADLEQQAATIAAGRRPAAAPALEEPDELTNRDFFWDWDGD